MKYKSKLLKGSILLFLILMILYPYASYEGASTGLLLWFHNVLPNLLPFIIISNLLIHLNITNKISSAFHPVLGRLFRISKAGCYPIIFGFSSGIPMGAKSTADLVSEHKINRTEGQFLLSLCNNASPMFIIGYITINQLKLPQIKYTLFMILYASAIISALLFRFMTSHRNCDQDVNFNIKHKDVNSEKKNGYTRFSFDILDSCIMNGFEVVTKIGGYIILFSTLAQIIKAIGPDMGVLKPFIMGILEITTGINQICNTNLSITMKIVLVAVLTSFGGLSGLAQTKSVLGNTGLSINSYLLAKLLNVIIAFLLTLLYVTIHNPV